MEMTTVEIAAIKILMGRLLPSNAQMMPNEISAIENVILFFL
jgi:hypothetical protein